jgi:mRNA-degrading endonuclease toxin of MazEF toxin-antitoxin module
MNVSRSNVVLVDFPFPKGAGGKIRPALIIQNDLVNARLLNTIVAQITGNIQRARSGVSYLDNRAIRKRTRVSRYGLMKSAVSLLG